MAPARKEVPCHVGYAGAVLSVVLPSGKLTDEASRIVREAFGIPPKVSFSLFSSARPASPVSISSGSLLYVKPHPPLASSPTHAPVDTPDPPQPASDSPSPQLVQGTGFATVPDWMVWPSTPDSRKHSRDAFMKVLGKRGVVPENLEPPCTAETCPERNHSLRSCPLWLYSQGMLRDLRLPKPPPVFLPPESKKYDVKEQHATLILASVHYSVLMTDQGPDSPVLMAAWPLEKVHIAPDGPLFVLCPDWFNNDSLHLPQDRSNRLSWIHNGTEVYVWRSSVVVRFRSNVGVDPANPTLPVVSSDLVHTEPEEPSPMPCLVVEEVEHWKLMFPHAQGARVLLPRPMLLEAPVECGPASVSFKTLLPMSWVWIARIQGDVKDKAPLLHVVRELVTADAVSVESLLDKTWVWGDVSPEFPAVLRYLWGKANNPSQRQQLAQTAVETNSLRSTVHLAIQHHALDPFFAKASGPPNPALSRVQFLDLWTADWLKPHIPITWSTTPPTLECSDLTKAQCRTFVQPDTPAEDVLDLLQRVGMKHQPNTTLKVLMTGQTQSGKTSFVTRTKPDGPASSRPRDEASRTQAVEISTVPVPVPDTLGAVRAKSCWSSCFSKLFSCRGDPVDGPPAGVVLADDSASPDRPVVSFR